MDKLSILEAARRWQEYQDAMPAINGMLAAAERELKEGGSSVYVAYQFQLDQLELLRELYHKAEAEGRQSDAEAYLTEWQATNQRRADHAEQKRIQDEPEPLNHGVGVAPNGKRKMKPKYR